MGKHSRKQKASHLGHLLGVAQRLRAAREADVPLPGQVLLHPSGPEEAFLHREAPVFRMSDGTAYAIDINGSFHRAPTGQILPVYGEER